MISIVTYTHLNIISYFDMGRFIKLYKLKLYKLELSEVLNALSYFCQP
jgi:hypothetical protein